MKIPSLALGVTIVGNALYFLVGLSMAATPPVVTEFTQGLPGDNAAGSDPSAITAGPGGLWFTDEGCPICGFPQSAVGLISTAGSIQEFNLTAGDIPTSIALGSDGDLWVVIHPDFNGSAIDRISPAGAVSAIPLATGVFPIAISAGPDGNLWFTDTGRPDGLPGIGRLTTAGTVTIFTPSNSGISAGSVPNFIAAGPDGNLWFTDDGMTPAIGRVTPDGQITEFSIGLNVGSSPQSIAPGPDGNLWFTDNGTTPAIGRISPDGVIVEFPDGLGTDSRPTGIASAPDGNIWFADFGCGLNCSHPYIPTIGRVTPSGAITLFTEAEITGLASDKVPVAFALGPDQNLWFPTLDTLKVGLPTQFSDASVGRLVLPTDTVSVLPGGNGRGTVTSTLASQVRGTPSAPSAIICASASTAMCSAAFLDATTVTFTASAAVGSVFTGWSGGGCSGTAPCAIPLAGADEVIVANFAPAPAVSLSIATTGNGTVASAPSGISCGSTCTASFASGTTVTLTAAPAAGFTFAGWSGGGCAGVETCSVTLGADTTVTANFMAQSASDIILVSSLLPTSRSVEVGATATVFAALVNASPDTAGTLCQIQPATAVPADFFFQTTDPATNHLVGTRNAPVTIPPGNAFQTFILGFTPSAEIAPTNIAFNFTCANAPAAASQTGLNTMLLSASTTPTPDIVALSATVNDDGIVHIPSAAGVGVFAVATANVGAASTLTVSANVGAANLPVSLALCQTVPATGQCMAAPTPSVTTAIGAGETPSFGIFVQGSGTVAAQPAANRVFVQFTDAGGAVRGSTSVAVQTK